MANNRNISTPVLATLAFGVIFLGILIPVIKYMFTMYWDFFLRIFPFILVSFSILIAVVLIYQFWATTYGEKKSYKMFKEKDLVSVRRAKELLLSVFARYGVPIIKTEEGFLIWKTTKIFCDAVEFVTHRFSQSRNQPTCLFEVSVRQGRYAGQTMMIHVPLSKGEKEISEENFQIIDENRFGFKLDRNYPLMPAMSEAQRTLEELYAITGGDTEKIEELKEISEATRGLPKSITPPSDAAPESFYAYNQMRRKYPPTRYRQYTPQVQPTEEGEGVEE